MNATGAGDGMDRIFHPGHFQLGRYPVIKLISAGEPDPKTRIKLDFASGGDRPKEVFQVGVLNHRAAQIKFGIKTNILAARDGSGTGD